MGRLRRKSSTAKEGSQSKGQTAIDQFFCKGPAQRGSLFTQVGLPARKAGPGSSKGPPTSGRTAGSRAKAKQPGVQLEAPCCSSTAVPAVQAVTVVPETQLTSPAAPGTSERGGARSEVIMIPDTQTAGTQFIGEFPDDSSDFVTATPKHKAGRKARPACSRGRSTKLSLRGRGASKENVAKQLGRAAGKRSNHVLGDVSSKSPDNVPGEGGATSCSPEELNKSLVIEPEGREWTTNKQVNNKHSNAGQNCAGEGSHDNHSADSDREHEGSAGNRTSSDTIEHDSLVEEDAVTKATLVQSDSPDIVPEAETRARTKHNFRSLATRTKQNSSLATNNLASRVSVLSCEDGAEHVSEDKDGRKLSGKDTSGSFKDTNKTSVGGKKWLSWTGSLLGKRSPARGSSPVSKRSRTPDAAGTQLRMQRGGGITCRRNLSAGLEGQDTALGQGQDTGQGQGQDTGQGQDQDTAQGQGQDTAQGQGPTTVQCQDLARGQGQQPCQGQNTTQGQEHLVSRGQGQYTAQGQRQQPSQGQGQQSQVKAEDDQVKRERNVKGEEHPFGGETSEDRTDTEDSGNHVSTSGRREEETAETNLSNTTDTGGTVKCHNAGSDFTSIISPVKSKDINAKTTPETEKQVTMETGKSVTMETDKPVAMETADPTTPVQQVEIGQASPSSAACEEPVAMATADPTTPSSVLWEDLNDSFFDLENLAGGGAELARSFSEMSPFKGGRRTNSSADDPTLGTADICNKFNRFRVQGVEAAVHDGYVTQLTLQLTNPAHRSGRTCVLRDNWAGLSVQSGDIVHVLAEFGADGVCTVDRDRGYIVVTPDLLMSSTAVSNGIKCLRRAVLSERFKGTDGSSKQMLLGTILHDVFQTATATSFSADSLKQISQQALQKQRHLRDMFSLSLTQAQLQEEIAEYLPVMRTWADTFYRGRGAEMEVKLPGTTYRNRGDERSNVVISAVTDIEENVWAPRFGLKGKLDVTTEVRIQPRSKGNDPLRRTLPLELKTGRETNSIEHRSQVILYTLLTREQHPDPELGLLLYLKTGNMKAVPAGHVDRRELLMLRNRLTSQLKHSLLKEGDNTVPAQLPPVINDPRGCKYCSQLANCALYNRAFEAGDAEGGMAELLRQETEHLKTSHLQYFSHWYLLVMLEDRETAHKSHLAHLWSKPAQDREKSGDCVHGLQLTRCAPGRDGDFTCTFRRKHLNPSSQTLTSLRLCVDDYILVSVEDRNMVAMCSGFLTELAEETLSVRVDRDLSKFPPDTVFTLDKKDGYVSTATSLANLARLMGKTASAERLRELIVERREPRFHARVSDMCPPDARDAIGRILKGLNQPQKQAIKKVLMARDFTLIVGMPGTGKTTSIVALVRILLACGNSVLLTSYTNSAVDNVLLKLSKFKIEYLRLGNSSRVHPGVAPHTDDQLARGLTSVAELDKLYMDKPVVATTCLGAKHALFSRRKFDVCIVDEASQIAQPVCLGPLVHAGRFVLVGDHQQLPPLVQSGTARRMGMDESLFKKMGHHQSATATLNVQYRMNSDIMELSNTLMYDGKLRCGSDKVATARLDLPAWTQLEEVMSELGVASLWIREALRPEAPVRFLDTDKVPAVETSEQGGLSNRTEAQLVRTLTAALVKAGCPQEDIGIIAPYRRQLRVLADLLQGAGCPGMESSTGYPGVEINTVDKYQGRDKSVILVSFVRSNSGGQLGELLQDWRRLNVAITRAKHKLLLIGSLSTLRRYDPVARLLEHLSANQMLLELPPGAENIPGNF
ncbi:DNA replication ATP-dependent helicase/nuclease DNA2-like isoform X2 [Branchiostoma lanceolatum]|uniref:DNA replication ATP-dependent helicase/nuclease DNA2-like isoform X2 n=1 Tax=Branchiostoma lanceolatum TaxID=7740 RepID=UPI0034522176